MKREMFAELLASTQEALEHSRGKRDLRTTTLPVPPKPMDGRAVKRVRAALRASQAVFAAYLNVSTKLVQAWEADRRTPDGPALVLLHLAARDPKAIVDAGAAKVRAVTTRRARSSSHSARRATASLR